MIQPTDKQNTDMTTNNRTITLPVQYPWSVGNRGTESKSVRLNLIIRDDDMENLSPMTSAETMN